MAAPVYGDALRWIKRECDRAMISVGAADDDLLNAVVCFAADLFGKEISDVRRDVQTLLKVQH